jgi:hypothetical protein
MRVLEDPQHAEHPQRHLVGLLLSDVARLFRINFRQHVVQHLAVTEIEE